MVYSSRETTNLKFWQERLRRAVKPLYAIGSGFDWEKIDDIHKKIFFEHYKEGMKVLDVACGIGRTANWIPKEDYTGFDFVPEFIEIAKKVHPDRNFIVADIQEPLPFKDKEFDIAVLISVKQPLMPNVKDWTAVEEELKRIAKKVIILEYGNNDPEEIYKYAEIL